MKDKLKGFFGGDDQPAEQSTDDAYYTTTKEEFHEQNGMAGSKMMLLDYIKNRCAVVVNLKRVTPDQAKRIVDFLYGTIYAIGGDLQKLGGGIFLCTPKNVNVEGTISEDNAANAKANNKKKDGKEEEEDFF